MAEGVLTLLLYVDDDIVMLVAVDANLTADSSVVLASVLQLCAFYQRTEPIDNID